MPSNLRHRMMRVPEKKLAGLATVWVVSFFCVLPSASAQSKTTHYRNHGSTRYSTPYKSASRIHSGERKTHSTSSVVPEVLGKPSGGAAVSPNKELDQLERANVVRPASMKSAASPAPAKSALAQEKHSAPINFTHKELPHSPQSGAAKNH